VSELAARIPAIVNVASGTADEARAALAASGAFDVHEVEPEAIAPTAKDLVAHGARRILVAGGDGTIATAAAALVESGAPAELAVLPGGTLNHFARDLGISTVAAEAVKLATSGTCRGVDVGMVNGTLFLNTSSVGAYVRFVRVRETLERSFGYRLASALAAFRILFTLRLMAVEVVVDGRKRIYRTPLVFIGVGERHLALPGLGQRAPGGKRGLHVIVVRGRSRARLLALGLAAVARGKDSVSGTPELDSFIVDSLRIDMRGMGTVAVDGEIVSLHAPLEYTLRRDALTVVLPPPDSLLAESA
jgi:diacylglycerol kinase family enzyme